MHAILSLSLFSANFCKSGKASCTPTSSNVVKQRSNLTLQCDRQETCLGSDDHIIGWLVVGFVHVSHGRVFLKLVHTLMK